MQSDSGSYEVTTRMAYQFTECVSCDRQILADEERCRYCGVNQEREPAEPGDVLVYGSLSEWLEYRVTERYENPIKDRLEVRAVGVESGKMTILGARQYEEAGWDVIREEDYDGSAVREME